MKQNWRQFYQKYGLSESNEPFPLKRISIAIVDPNERALESLCTFFKKETDYQVHTFASPLDALNHMTENETQLLLANSLIDEVEGASFLETALLLHPDLNGIIMAESGYNVKAKEALKSLKFIKGFQYLKTALDKDDLLIAMENAVENIYLTTILEIKTRVYNRILSEHNKIQKEIVMTFM